ncbi:M20 metallopeptidase family protein [Sediminibacillus massiliensis]|uniref:M20 metallopeptidase family protein n=1 Tax=Sediminibacillus massiliensis TaxID=1926277 RepID=UPI0009888684|nr:amidohydrolase [Sediminibacillus massiliensis]
MINNLFEELKQLEEELITIRRDLHMHPELSNEEKRTPAFIADHLKSLGLEVRTNFGGNGVVGYLRGEQPGKTIALRADFDALPIQDEKNVPYKSTVPGVAHACGHDVHTAALLGVARVLSSRKSTLAGTVVFIHQFAEEVAPGGAKRMIADGCLEGVDAVYGAHVWSENQIGEVLFNEGYTMAAADTFEITISGRGGHGAMPHLAIDPVVAASQLVMSLQQIVSRNVDPLKAAVVTVGSLHSGHALNVIPDSASVGGTVRTYDPAIRELAEKKIRDAVKAVEIHTGVKGSIDYVYGHTSLYNHAEPTRQLKQLAEQYLPEVYVKKMNAFMGAEDFAYYLEEVPGTFFFVGGRNEELDAVYPHHHPKFDVDEKAISTIGRLFFLSLLNHGVVSAE